MVATLCGESGGTSKPIELAEIVRDRAERARERKDARPFAGRHREAGEDLGRIGKLVERLDHGDAGVRHQSLHHGVIAGERAGMRACRLLGARSATGMHHDDRLAGAARAIGGGHEGRRPADMLGVDHDHARRRVISEEIDEVDQIEPGLVAGRDRVGRGETASIKCLAQMAHEAAALRHDRQRRIARARYFRHHRRMGEAGREAIDIVGVAEAIRSEQRHVAVARHGRELVLQRPHLLAHLGEAGGEHHGGSHLAAYTRGKRILHAGGRQGEDRKINALGKLIDARPHRPAVDLVGAANEMYVAGKVVDLEVLEHGLASGTGLARDADDCDRVRPHQPPYCGSAARTGMHFQLPRSVVISRCKCSISSAPVGSKSG